MQHSFGRRGVGHPVDVSTGIQFGTWTDFTIPGRMDLIWERSYSTQRIGDSFSILGPGWSLPFLASLRADIDGYLFTEPDGMQVAFDDPGNSLQLPSGILNPGAYLQLTKERDAYVVTQWTPDPGDIKRFVFPFDHTFAPQPLRSIEYVNGQGLDLFYDDGGRLTVIVQRRENRRVCLNYNDAGLLASVVTSLEGLSDQLKVRYEYDSIGRLRKASNPLGFSDEYGYDSAHRMIREIPKAGGSYIFRYDELGRCVYTSGENSCDEKLLRFIDEERATQVTNSLGNVWRFEWNYNCQLERAISPLGAVDSYLYDEYGRVREISTPTGGSWKFKYDSAGNRAELVTPEGFATRIGYNQSHQMTSYTDARGYEWTGAHDSRGYLVQTIDPANRCWNYLYDGHGDLTEMKGPGGFEAHLRYSKAGDLVEFADRKGSTFYEWDYEGRLIGRRNSLGGKTRYVYDKCGQVVKIVWPDESFVRLGYHPSGKLAQLVNENGVAVKYRYGPCGLLQERMDGQGFHKRFIWGTEPSQLLEVHNEKDEIYRFRYDADGRIEEEVGFDGRRRNFIYDNAGECSRVKGANGEVKLERDVMGRLTCRVTPDGVTERFAYDQDGYLVEATNANCRVTFRYDPVGRILEETQNDLVTRNEYGAWGRISRTSPLGNKITFDYEGGQLVGAWLSNGERISWQHDRMGREAVLVLPSGLAESHEYDERGRISRLRVKESGRSVIERKYVYDAAGRLLQVSDLRKGVTQFSYDAGDHVVGVEDSRSGIQQELSYDSCGNIVEWKSDNSSVRFEYTSGNRLDKVSGAGELQAYSYDGDGNLKERRIPETDSVASCQYDALGRLLAVKRNDVIAEFKYDALGRRISKCSGEHEVKFLWEDYTLLGEIHRDGGERKDISSEYLFSRYKPLYVLRGKSGYAYHTNHLGTPCEITDSHRQIVWSGVQDVYGSVGDLEINKIDNLIRFPGQYYDGETALHYNVLRYYDPDTGRYITQDPIGLEGGANLYAYARNPINDIDPIGLQPPGPTPGGNVLPAYQGGKTSGVFVRPSGGGETPLVSGYDGPSAGTSGIPGMNGNIKSHVEAHAAAIMRQEDLTEAELYINRVPCPGKRGCDAMLERMLPEGATLKVIGPDGYEKTYTGTPDPPGRPIEC